MIDRHSSGAHPQDTRAAPADLPLIPAEIMALSRGIARQAKLVLSLSGATTFSVSRYKRHGLRSALWNARFAPDPEMMATCLSNAVGADALKDLESGAATLIDHLAGRWPATHTPVALGFVTDGNGIAFSPDDPCPNRPGWLLSQLSGETGLTAVIPFAGARPWGRIQLANPESPPH